MKRSLFFLLPIVLLFGCQNKIDKISSKSITDSIFTPDVADDLDTSNKEIIDEDGVATRQIVTDFELYEFINPKLGEQIAAVADSCFGKNTTYFILTIMPTGTLYVKRPGVDPEKGTEYNARIETHNNEYYDIEIDSSFFHRQKICVKIGKRLCFVHMEADSPKIVKPTGKHYIDRHYTEDNLCLCSESDRMLQIGDDGSIKNVYPVKAFAPEGKLDTLLFVFADEYPTWPNNGQSLEQFIAKKVDWPEDIKRTYAYFTVEMDGRVSNIEIVRKNPDPEERAFVESIRKILPSMPRWNPGKIQGKIVRTRLPFVLERPQ